MSWPKKMKRVLWSIYLTVVCVLLTVQGVPDSSDIQSFGAYPWNLVNKYFTEETTGVTTTGTDIQLRCTFSDTVTSQNVTIRRLDQDIQLNQIYDESTLSLRVNLTHVTCNEQGTYVCGNGAHEEMLDLGITDCGPKLCNNEANPKIVYAKMSEPTTFYVCIVMHNISKLLYINDVKLREHETKGTMTWESTYKEHDNCRHYLSFTVITGSKKDYKTYDVTLTSPTTETKMGDKFRIELNEIVDPKCPTGIKVVSRTTDSITFSWQPGDHATDSQWFLVNYTCESCSGWKNERNRDKSNSVTIFNLLKNENYKVRIDPYNSTGPITACKSLFEFNTVIITALPTPTSTTTVPSADAVVTTTTTTTKDINSTNTSNESTVLFIIIGILSVLIIIMVIIAVVLCLRDCIFGKFNCRWSTSTPSSHRNIHHTQETAQQISLIDSPGNGAHYQNVNSDEPLYENETVT